ncbi:MAG: FGGY family carbohydrate kinase, partial [Oscillospiraceae bacterium]
MNNYIIGVDIGTQGTKAMLFDLDLNVISSAFEPSRLVSPKPGCIWQEPDDLYLSCARTIKELMDKSGKTPNSILSIGIDGQMAGIMGIDSKGEAVTYYDSWLDVRSAEYTSRLQQLAGNEAVSRSGGQITSNQSTKILWWKYQHPEIYRKIAKFVLPHSYVIGRMTGLLAEQSIFDYTCLHFNSFSDNFNKSWNKPLLK